MQKLPKAQIQEIYLASSEKLSASTRSQIVLPALQLHINVMYSGGQMSQKHYFEIKFIILWKEKIFSCLLVGTMLKELNVRLELAEACFLSQHTVYDAVPSFLALLPVVLQDLCACPALKVPHPLPESKSCLARVSVPQRLHKFAQNVSTGVRF